MMKKKLCALAIPLALAACSGRSGAEKAVRDMLKDPDSAKFGEFYYNSKTGRACLTTNAKNSMGGYTGDSQSQLEKDNSGWHYAGDTQMSQADCREYFADKGVVKVDTSGMSADEMEKEADRLEAEADRVGSGSAASLSNAVENPR